MALWSKTKTQSKVGFDKVYNWVDKLGAPVNRLSNRVGSEAFWPTTLDIESDKAARILKSFCSKSPLYRHPQPLTLLQRMAFMRKKTDQPPPMYPKENKRCLRRYRPKSYKMQRAFAYSQQCGQAFGSPGPAGPAYWSHAKRMAHGHRPLAS